MRLRQALRDAVSRLRAGDIPSPELAAELLLMHVLRADRSHLYTHLDDELASDLQGPYFGLIAERGTGKPTQYITGRQEFWGLDFEVNPDVLIPRPETEHLVEAVLELGMPVSDKPGGLRMVDVGTGSGCIAAALASAMPKARVFASDISQAALAVAQRNALRLGLVDRLRFVQSDLLAAFSPSASFDFVVSNPPYVGLDELDHVQREVREFEPRIAWTGSGEGAAIYQRLFAESLRVLRPDGYVVVEVGYNQAERVRAMLKDGWSGTEIRPDLAGIPRVVITQKTRS
jgi:release factor glutamine methyltransferase